MKKPLRQFIFVASLILVGVLILQLVTKNAGVENATDVKSNVKSNLVTQDQGAESYSTPAVSPLSNTASAVGGESPASSDQVLDLKNPDIKNCLATEFKVQLKADTLEQLKNEVLIDFELPATKLEQVEYQLRGHRNEDIRIQKNFNVPINEIVRVYQIDEELMPDVIRNYPQSDSDDVQSKINGALTLGRLQKEVQRFQSEKNDAILEYEVTAEKVTAVRFSKGKSQLNCDFANCQCLRF